MFEDFKKSGITAENKSEKEKKDRDKVIRKHIERLNAATVLSSNKEEKKRAVNVLKDFLGTLQK